MERAAGDENSPWLTHHVCLVLFADKKTAALWYKAAVRKIPVEALYGTPGTTRTYDLRIRSPLLYPAELQARRVVLIFG